MESVPRCRSFSRLLPVLFFFVLAGGVRAQRAVPVLDHLIPPAPDAAALTPAANTGAAMYTGQPEVVIPLWELTGSRVSVAVTLTYRSSGMQVDALEGWTGMGWTLHAGGVITRTVRGQPDDLPTGYLSTGTAYLTPQEKATEPFFHWQPPGNKEEAYLLLHAAAQGRVDLEPDIFRYAFPGHYGTFFLGAGGEVFLMTPDDLLIECRRDAAGEITGWRITDELGIVYLFGGGEEACDRTRTVTPGGAPGESWHSAWHLVRIEDPHAADMFTFTYQGRTIERRYPVTLMRQGCDDPDRDESYRYSSQLIEEKHLHEIVHDRGGGQVRVSFLTEEKGSYPGGSILALREIVVHHPADEALSRHFRFRYSFFPTTGCGAAATYLPPCRRLRLDALQVTAGSNSQPPYLFFYDEQPVPPRGSFAKDLWGYYNGRRNASPVPALTVINTHDAGALDPQPGYDGAVNMRWFMRARLNLSYAAERAWQLPGADRRPDTVKVMAGMLKKIIYPTGGLTLLEYEPNKVGYVMVPAGERRREVAARDGKSMQTSFLIDPAQEVRLLPLFYRMADSGSIDPLDRIVIKKVENDSERIVFSLTYDRLLREAAGREAEYRLWLEKGFYLLEAACRPSDRVGVVIGRLFFRHGTYDRIYRVYSNDYERQRITAGMEHFPDDSSYAVERTFTLGAEDDRLVRVSWYFRSVVAPNLISTAGLSYPYTFVRLEGADDTIPLLEAVYPVADTVEWNPVEGYHWSGERLLQLRPGTFRLRFLPRLPGEAGYIRVEYDKAVRTHPYAVAGGVRLKRRIDLDGEQDTVLVRTYEYLRHDLPRPWSSGVLTGIPLFWDQPEEIAYWGDQPFFDRACFPLQVFSLARAEIPATRGSMVGYACVTEHLPGNGRTVMWYTSPLDHPDVSRLHFPFAPGSSSDWLRGREKERFVYAEDGRLREHRLVRYAPPDDTLFLRGMPGVKVVQRDPDNIYSCRYSVTFMRRGWSPPLQEEVWRYDTTGRAAYHTVRHYAYDPAHYMRREVRQHSSDGRTLRSRVLRPFDLTDTVPGVDLLLERHMTGVTMGEESYVDTLLVAGRRIFFGRHGERILPDSVQTLEGRHYRTYLWYDRYDDRGHLLQYHRRGEAPHALQWDAWGRPVLEAAGTPYMPSGQYPSAAMVRKYGYDPLFGRVWAEEPNGSIVRYAYDSLGRLRCRYDAPGRIVRSYVYRYRGYDGDTSRPYFHDPDYVPSVAADSVVAVPATAVRHCPVRLTVTGGYLGTAASWHWYRDGCGVHPLDTGTTILIFPAATATYSVRAEGLLNTTPCRSIRVEVHDPAFLPPRDTLRIAAAGTANPLPVDPGYQGCEPWQVTTRQEWLTIREKNEDSFLLHVDPNPADTLRRGSLILQAGALARTIFVMQEGAADHELSLLLTATPPGVTPGTQVTITAILEGCEQASYSWAWRLLADDTWQEVTDGEGKESGQITLTAGTESFLVRCTASCIDGRTTTATLTVNVAE